VNWDARVRGTDTSGLTFDETTSVANLSSTGAFLPLATEVENGMRIEVSIRVPLKKRNWMNYSGEVVRVEAGRSHAGIAIRFDTPKPVFSNK